MKKIAFDEDYKDGFTPHAKCNYVDADDNIYILGEFDETINEHVIPYIIKIIQTKEGSKHPELNLFINSNGGYASILHSLLCVLDIAKEKGFTITTTVMGRAYSCGSLLACYGDYRRMFKYGNHLMHFGSSGDYACTPKQNQRIRKHTDEHFESLVDIYAEHSKLSKEKIRELMEDDCLYLNPQECLEYGLIDEIIGVETETKVTEEIVCPTKGFVDLELPDGKVRIVGTEYNKEPETKKTKKKKKSKKSGVKNESNKGKA